MTGCDGDKDLLDSQEEHTHLFLLETILPDDSEQTCIALRNPQLQSRRVAEG